ncbi:MAG: energy transducer TonB [Rhodomicrobiaceae bacterium]
MIKSVPTNFLLPRGDGQSQSEDLNLLDFREPVQRSGQATHWAMIFALIALHGGLIAYLVGFARIANPSGAETAPRAIPVEIVSSRRHDTLPKEDLEIRRKASAVLAGQTLTDIPENKQVAAAAFPVITRSVKLAQAEIGVLPEDGGRVDQTLPQEPEAEITGRKKEAAPRAEQEAAGQIPLLRKGEQGSEQQSQALNSAEPVRTLAETLPEDGAMTAAPQKSEARLPEDSQLSDAQAADHGVPAGKSDPVEWLQARDVAQESTAAEILPENGSPAEAANASSAPSSAKITETGLEERTGKHPKQDGFISASQESPMPSDLATDGAKQLRIAKPTATSPKLQEPADRYGQTLASQVDSRWPEDLGKADAEGQTASVAPETDLGSYKPGSAVMRGAQEKGRPMPLEAPLPERRTVYAHEIASHNARGKEASKPRETASAKPRNSRRELLDNYRGEVRKHLASYRPPGGFGADTVVVGFTLTRSGEVATARILKSRGIYHLEQGTLNAVHRAAPFPLPPGDLSGARFHFAIPFRFE